MLGREDSDDDGPYVFRQFGTRRPACRRINGYDGIDDLVGKYDPVVADESPVVADESPEAMARHAHVGHVD